MYTNSIIRTEDLHVNKNAYRTSNRSYYCVHVVQLDGTRTACLLTEDDILKGIDRAYKNPEDVLPLSKVQRLLNTVLKWFK